MHHIQYDRRRKMFCKYCGYRLRDGAIFCPKCGKKIVTIDMPEPNNVHMPESSKGQYGIEQVQSNLTSESISDNRCIIPLNMDADSNIDKRNKSCFSNLHIGLAILMVVIIILLFHNLNNRKVNEVLSTTATETITSTVPDSIDIVSENEELETETITVDETTEVVEFGESTKQTDITAVADMPSQAESGGFTMSPDEIETEVLRIREVWESDRESVSDGIFDCEIWKNELNSNIYVYSMEGDIKMIEAPANGENEYSKTFQIENGMLTFAYYESSQSQIRLYYKDYHLFRWIQTDAGRDALIHDMELDNREFIKMENWAMFDLQTILNMKGSY